MTPPLPVHSSVPAAQESDAAESLLIELSRLRLLGDKVAHVHGAAHPEMVIFAATAGRIAETFAAQVIRLNDGGIPIPAADATQVGEDVVRLRTLSNDFTPWAGACASVALLLRGWAQAATTLAALLVKA